MRKPIPFLIASAMLFTSCGVVDKLKEKFGEVESAIDSKSEEYLEKHDPKSLAKDEAEEIFEYLKDKDTAALIKLFAKDSAKNHDLEKEWNDFFSRIDGDIESFERISFPDERLTVEDGVISDSGLNVRYNNTSTSTGKTYEIGYYQQRKYPKNPDAEGINLFYINYRDEKGILTDQFTVGRMSTK